MAAFDAELLIAEAVAQAGTSDFGGDDWQTAYHRLVEDLNRQPFHEAGKETIRTSLRAALTARLRIERWIAEHPQVQDEGIEGPIIIFGLPRTASSALQNVLSTDPQWRYLRQWEAEEPVPPPVLGEEDRDPRALRERALMANDQTFKGKHIHIAGGPVEDGALARLSFGGQEQVWPVFDYTAWWRDQPKRAMLYYLKRALQLLQSRRPPKRWLLKTPWYAFCLEDLRAVFPGARFIMTHRHPRDVIPSVASLHYTGFSRFMDGERLSKPAIGAQALEHWRIGMQRALDYRQAHPQDDVFDVGHTGFNADPMGVLKALYAWLGAEMTPAAERPMAEWIDANRRGSHGEHRYDVADYGVSGSEIDGAFRDYIAAFDLAHRHA